MVVRETLVGLFFAALRIDYLARAFLNKALCLSD